MCSRMFDSSPEIFVDLLVAELQARQARDVQDLLTVDHGSRVSLGGGAGRGSGGV